MMHGTMNVKNITGLRDLCPLPNIRRSNCGGRDGQLHAAKKCMQEWNQMDKLGVVGGQ